MRIKTVRKRKNKQEMDLNNFWHLSTGVSMPQCLWIFMKCTKYIYEHTLNSALCFSLYTYKLFTIHFQHNDHFTVYTHEQNKEKNNVFTKKEDLTNMRQKKHRQDPMQKQYCKNWKPIAFRLHWTSNYKKITCEYEKYNATLSLRLNWKLQRINNVRL